ncbi:hypothetical protein GGF32_005642 [Allomyces javanicus]|nr:hypothetical protein GGF32_005642 [Allomyces javanicus]
MDAVTPGLHPVLCMDLHYVPGHPVWAKLPRLPWRLPSRRPADTLRIYVHGRHIVVAEAVRDIFNVVRWAAGLTRFGHGEFGQAPLEVEVTVDGAMDPAFAETLAQVFARDEDKYSGRFIAWPDLANNPGIVFEIRTPPSLRRVTASDAGPHVLVPLSRLLQLEFADLHFEQEDELDWRSQLEYHQGHPIWSLFATRPLIFRDFNHLKVEVVQVENVGTAVVDIESLVRWAAAAE